MATYRWADGRVYEGPFVDGYMHGYGRLKATRGKGEYQGSFIKNLKSG